MSSRWLGVLLLLLLQSEVTLFQTDLPPGEGPHVYVATISALRLHDAPSTASRIVRTITVSVDRPTRFVIVRPLLVSCVLFQPHTWRDGQLDP